MQKANRKAIAKESKDQPQPPIAKGSHPPDAASMTVIPALNVPVEQMASCHFGSASVTTEMKVSFHLYAVGAIDDEDKS